MRGVLAAVAPIVGTARVMSAGGKIFEALEIDLELAALNAEADEEALPRFIRYDTGGASTATSAAIRTSSIVFGELEP